MKTTSVIPWFILAAVLLLGAAPAVEVAEALRKGNEAFHQQQYKEALEWYQKAEERSIDPGLVAYNQAVAFYQLGQFREAELHFRRCLEDATGPRAAQALYGLGNSLLLTAGPSDVQALQSAIKCYQQCRQRQDLPTDLHEPANQNLELARLLLVQALVEAAKKPPESGGNDKPKNPPGGSEPSPNPDGPNPTQPDPLDPSKGQAQVVDNLDPNSLGKATVPQRGKPPVIPDDSKLIPIPAEDTAAYLQQVAERIWQDSQQARQGKTNPVQGVKDW